MEKHFRIRKAIFTCQAGRKGINALMPHRVSFSCTSKEGPTFAITDVGFGPGGEFVWGTVL